MTNRVEQSTQTQARSMLVIANPQAGGSALATADEVVSDFGDALAVDVVTTREPLAAISEVAERVASATAADPIDLVVAVGGDGTVREVAEGLTRGLGDGDPVRTSLAVAPAGSGNSIYLAAWGDANWRTVLAAAVRSPRPGKLLDLIRLEEADRAALLGVNVGLVAQVARVIERRKADSTIDDTDDTERYWQAFAEVLEVLEAPNVRIEADGKTIHEGPTALATVGGARKFGRGTFELLPRAELDDGLLDVCVLGGASTDDIVRLSALVPDGRHVEDDAVTYVQCNSVSITELDDQPLLIEHDGDPYDVGATLTLNVAANVLPIVASA